MELSPSGVGGVWKSSDILFGKKETLTDDSIGSAVQDKYYRLRALEHWDRGIESHWGHGCMSAIFLCLCCPA
jgi:hypothetical protein